MMTQQLTCRFLGTFSISIDDQPLTQFRSDKVRALLAYLALEAGNPRARTTLAALLWPEVADKHARHSLRTTLYHLRQSLDAATGEGRSAPSLSEQLLTVSHQEIQFNTDTEIKVLIDVSDFRALLAACEAHPHADLATCAHCLPRLEQAGALYQGEFLAGFGFGDAPDFEEWVLLQREMLQQQALLTFERLAGAYEGRGEVERAHSYAARLLHLDPYREVARRLVMRLLTRRGLPDQALAQYAKCRQLLMEELGAEPETETVALAERIRRGELQDGKGAVAPASVSPSIQQPCNSATLRHDWREMPVGSPFFGRDKEVAQLRTWLVDERCHLVSILAIGGMGKTSLAAEVVPTIAEHFDLVIWRSLLNAPPLAELLSTFLPTLSHQQIGSLPESLDQQLQLLFEQMQVQRVLLVLDNLESILQADAAGQYRAGYEGYEQLLHGMAIQPHQGQLLLTSREWPSALRRLDRDTSQVRTLQLHGLDDTAGEQLLVSRGLAGGTGNEAALTERYSGNPLALKLVADTVQDLFFGDVQGFLAEGSFIFDDVRRVLDHHFARLSELEQEILFWLAIERAPVDVPILREILLHPPVGRALLEALNSLQRRSLIERQADGFGLQNVITEYLTDRLVETAIQELTTIQLDLLHRHAYLIAQTKEYVRRSQERLILQPITQQLEAQFDQVQLREFFTAIVEHLHECAEETPSYAAGNLLNLMLHIELDVAGFDLSKLSVWQVDMQRRPLADLNLAQADLTNCLFRQTFGLIEPVAISPDGQVIALGDEFGEIRFYRASDGQLLLPLSGHTNTVIELKYSVDGRLLAGCSHDQTARIWETESGHLLHTLSEQAGSLYTVAFSTDGWLLASGAEDAKIYVWDVQNGRLLLILEKHTRVLTSILFVPDSYTLLSTGCDGQILAWDLSDVVDAEECRQAAEPCIIRNAQTVVYHAETIFTSLALSNDQMSIAAGTFESTIFVWGFADGTLHQTLQGHADEAQDLAFWPDDATLVSSSSDATIRIWDVQTGRCLDILNGHSSVVKSLGCCPTKRTFVSGSEDGTACIWEITPQGRGVLMRTIRGNVEVIRRIVWNMTAPIVATGDALGNVCLWDVSQPNPFCLYELQELSRVTDVAFSPNGQLLMTTSEAQSNVVHLWDVESREKVGVLTGHDSYPRAVVFSPDSTILASGANDGRICLWDVTNPAQHKLLQMLDGHHMEVDSLAFSPDGRLLVSAGGDQATRVWDLNAGVELYSLPAHQNNNSVVWHPTASIFAYVAPDEQIIITDVAYATSEQFIQRFPSHTSIVYALAFSPDGTQLASVGTDQMMRVWDVANGEPVHCISVHQNVFSIAFSPDGQMLAAAGQDGIARLWALATEQCVHVLRTPRLYQDMNISGVTGITEAQKAALKVLGAVAD